MKEMKEMKEMNSRKELVWLIKSDEVEDSFSCSYSCSFVGWVTPQIWDHPQFGATHEGRW